MQNTAAQKTNCTKNLNDVSEMIPPTLVWLERDKNEGSLEQPADP